MSNKRYTLHGIEKFLIRHAEDGETCGTQINNRHGKPSIELVLDCSVDISAFPGAVQIEDKQETE